MITKNDRIFSALYTSSLGVCQDKFVYNIYMMQCYGFELGYKYNIMEDRIKSTGYNQVYSNLTSFGSIDENGGITDSGDDAMSGYLLEYRDLQKLDYISNLIKTLDKIDLFYICVVDILIQESLSLGGVSTLIREKNKILLVLDSLLPDYNEQDFNEAIDFMMEVRER